MSQRLNDEQIGALVRLAGYNDPTGVYLETMRATHRDLLDRLRDARAGERRWRRLARFAIRQAAERDWPGWAACLLIGVALGLVIAALVGR